MSATLEWTDGSTELLCRVCEFAGDGSTEAIVARHGLPDLTCVRCPTCGSVDIRGLVDNAYTDSDTAVDEYVENLISIETVGDLLTSASPTSVTSFLDVGCNYGFGVDLGQRLLGWRSRGIEPSEAGLRGRAELGVRIDNEFLTNKTDLGERFDLVLASEVLEHVPDPIDFLSGILNHLSETGRVVLTTPSADAVNPAHNERDVIHAISPGLHQFLPSPAGMELLLRRAGFRSVTVVARGDNLRAIASPRLETLEFDSSPPSPTQLEQYYSARATDSPAGSALAIGMASRMFRSLVNRGAYDLAVPARDLVIALIAERYGVNASDPVAAIEQLASARSKPSVLVPVAYHSGVLAHLHENDDRRAIEFFALTEQAALAHATVVEVLDSDSANLVMHAGRVRARTLARLGDPQVLDGIEHLDTASQAQAFVTTVTSGHLDLARSLRATAARVAVALAEVPATTVTGLDTLLCLAMLDLQSSAPLEAKAWLDLARARFDSRAADVMSSAQAADFAANLEATVGAVRAPAVVAHGAPALRTDEPLTPAIPGAVSVVLPVYNGQLHIREAVQSVVDQTLQPHELVVVDDGSTDAAISIVESMQLPFPVRIVRQANQGQSAARNAGGRLASGEFLAFIDQDDRWLEDHLAMLQPTIGADRSLGWVFTDFDQVDAEGRTITTHFIAETGVQHPKRSLAAAMAGDLMALPSASIMRRSAVFDVGGFDPGLIGYEDDDLFLRLFRAGWRHAFLPESTIRYRMHARGSSASPTFLRSRVRFMAKLLATVPDDHRLNTLFSQDVVIPRFMKSTLSDYASALASKDYELAGVIARALRDLSMMQGATGLRRRMQLAALDHPRRMRTVLLILEKIPRGLRPRVPEQLFFSGRSIMRAARFHPNLPQSD